MDIGDSEDDCLTSIDYSNHYPLEENGFLSDSWGVTTGDDRYEQSPNLFSLEKLNAILKQKGKGDLFVMHINAVSLVKYFDEIESLISAKTLASPDILCISETRFKDEKIDFQTQLTALPEYSCIYDNSPTNTGGVAIYIKNTIKYFVKREFRLDVPDCESLFLELDFSGTAFNGLTNSLTLGCI